MKHNGAWLTLMVITILVVVAATSTAQALFMVSCIGLLGALAAMRQRIARTAVLVSVAASFIAAVVAAVLVAIGKH